ncbi:MAG: GNAT family N-acetyltransferase [Cytophagaceae bacterium]|jgi:ribosomal protein S18 acetylase RimI-like enzyme|nr:GNAT family N-acetyltransferase [Cytophagaceae bacterium]
MKYTRIKNVEQQLFVQAWNLYKESFPPVERRHLQSQKNIMNNPLYHFELITDENMFIGFIMWWSFKNVRYIEHLAIFLRLQGNGYGTRILNDFISKSDIPVLLEVEHPENMRDIRRIDFYKRVGFVLNTHPYKHPPYKKGGEYVSLMLMTYPQAITNEELTRFIEEYHPIIHRFVLAGRPVKKRHILKQN